MAQPAARGAMHGCAESDCRNRLLLAEPLLRRLRRRHDIRTGFAVFCRDLDPLFQGNQRFTRASPLGR